ncbi:MAG: hypothetical protein ACM31O_17000 [Bacteroidota bacterium]
MAVREPHGPRHLADREARIDQERVLPLHDFRQPVTPRSDTRKYLFNGFSRCALDKQRFHSDDERRFAVLIDQHSAEVKVWLKPGPGVFQITYQRGSKYEPDFLVETATQMLMCEVKARSIGPGVEQVGSAAYLEWSPPSRAGILPWFRRGDWSSSCATRTRRVALDDGRLGEAW